MFAYAGRLLHVELSSGRFLNSLCLCTFLVRDAAAEPNVRDMVALAGAATGWNLDLAELLTMGERNWNFARAFSCREGVRRRDDALPPRFARLLPTGATEGPGRR